MSRLAQASPSRHSELLKPYVPRLLIDWLRVSPSARHREVEGSLAFVDISGFTNLTERLARKGRVGSEEINDTLDLCFTESSCVKHESSVSLTSSAPILPLRARRSVSFVKPEMSTKASDPSTERWRADGSVCSHSITSRGTYGLRTSDDLLVSRGLALTFPLRAARPERYSQIVQTASAGLSCAP